MLPYIKSTKLASSNEATPYLHFVRPGDDVNLGQILLEGKQPHTSSLASRRQSICNHGTFFCVEAETGSDGWKWSPAARDPVVTLAASCDCAQ